MTHPDRPRMNTESSPFTVEVLRRLNPTRLNQQENVTRITRIGSLHMVVRRRSYDCTLVAGAPLACVGSTILGASKVLLLEAIGFLVRYLDPRMGEMLYCDTDSVFLALSNPVLEENVSSALRQEFVNQMPHFINSTTRVSGYLLLETRARSMYIFGEKMYCFEDEQNRYLKPRMKGVPAVCLESLNQEAADGLTMPGATLNVYSNRMKRGNDGSIGLQGESKRFKLALNPRKRQFVNQHSLPWF